MVSDNWVFHSRNPKKICSYILNTERKEKNLERSKKVKDEVLKIIKEILAYSN